MSLSSRALVSISAAIGLLAAGTSLYVHYGLLTSSGSSSFCDLNQTINCTQAYLSQYGEIRGVPVALGGVLYFALVLVGAAIAWKKPSGDHVPAYIFAMSVPALAFVVYLAYAAFFILHTFCILCAITYAAVLAITMVSWRATTFPIATLPERAAGDVARLRSSPQAIGITVLFIIAGVAGGWAFPRPSHTAVTAAPTFEALPPVSDEERARLAQWWEVQPKVDLGIDAGGAKVVVVKFNDYQCPPCGLTYRSYKSIFEKHREDVKFVLKHFPLEPECNGAVASVVHVAACEAAAAVNMARAKGTSDRLEEWLFANQGPPILSSQQVRDAALSVGGISDFDAQYPQVLKEVRADAVLGEKLKVGSTPTFFINGRKVPEILAAQYFNVLIEVELKR